MAVLIDPGRLRLRRASPAQDDADALLDDIRRARQRRPGRGSGFTRERADELVSQIRRARDDSGRDR